MLGLYSAGEVRAAEELLLATVPAGALMQRASFGLAVECARLLREAVGGVSGSRIVGLIGSGNNGGDALFAAAQLQRRGAQVLACTVADRWHEAGAAALVAAGGRVVPIEHVDASEFESADMIVDGLLGIGTTGPLRDSLAHVVQTANAADALRVAVDVPSGIGVDDGTVQGEIFQADVTVTFGCAKQGLFRFPGSGSVGAVRMVDIGLADYLPTARWCVITPDDVVRACPVPNASTYKYRRGIVGVAAGSPSYPGAAVLVVGGARYTGVGMTAILDRRDGVAQAVVEHFPDVVMTTEDPRAANRVGSWICGAGFVGDDEDEDFIIALASCEQPLVLDAGALSVLARSSQLQGLIRQRFDEGRITVITPHAGELSGLLHDTIQTPEALAANLGAIVVVKGPSTVIVTPDGTGFCDPVGTADLACAGSGDVLAGLIGGLLAAQRPDESDAVETVAAAVWLHGVAGRMAAADDSPIVATDLIDAIPSVIAGVRRGEFAW